MPTSTLKSLKKWVKCCAIRVEGQWQWGLNGSQCFGPQGHVILLVHYPRTEGYMVHGVLCPIWPVLGGIGMSLHLYTGAWFEVGIAENAVISTKWLIWGTVAKAFWITISLCHTEKKLEWKKSIGTQSQKEPLFIMIAMMSISEEKGWSTNTRINWGFFD